MRLKVGRYAKKAVVHVLLGQVMAVAIAAAAATTAAAGGLAAKMKQHVVGLPKWTQRGSSRTQGRFDSSTRALRRLGQQNKRSPPRLQRRSGILLLLLLLLLQ
jgi:hypothetical protein